MSDRQLIVNRILGMAVQALGSERARLALSDVSGAEMLFSLPQGVPATAGEAVLCAALKSREGRLLGRLEVFGGQKGPFSDGDQALLESIAHFAGLALEVAGPVTHPEDFNLRRAKDAFEFDFIRRALLYTGGNKSQAARLLGITREGLRKALKRAA